MYLGYIIDQIRYVFIELKKVVFLLINVTR